MFHFPYYFVSGLPNNVFDPCSVDVLDPFQGFPFGSPPARAAPARSPPARSTPARSPPARFSPLAREISQFFNTRIDWKEKPEAHVIKVDLPGLKKEDVKIEVEEGRILQISGERIEEHEEENEKWYRIERSSGDFVRRFRLPENAKMDHVNATMENGVLTVTVPKEEVKMPAVKAIHISG